MWGPILVKPPRNYYGTHHLSLGLKLREAVVVAARKQASSSRSPHVGYVEVPTCNRGMSFYNRWVTVGLGKHLAKLVRLGYAYSSLRESYAVEVESR